MEPRKNGPLSKKTLKIAAVCLLGAFLFYWFQVRPIYTYRSCTVRASVDARKLLATKASLTSDKTQAAFYKDLVSKNMYLRKDYESFLSKCLLYYGLQVPSTITTGSGAVEDTK